MDKIDRFFFRGMRGGGVLFHSILFKVAIMLDNLDPPPRPKKKKFKKGKMAHFGLQAALLLISLGGIGGGGGVAPRLKTRPGIQDCFAAQCDK